MRTVAATLVIVGLAVLAAGCSGSAGNRVAQLGTTTTGPNSSSSSSGSAGGSGSLTALRFSQCMRSHGVTKFPDISSLAALIHGSFKIGASMERLGVSSSQYHAAHTACRHFLPNGGRITPSESQQDLQAMLVVARCIRAHGVPTWPDPTNGPAGWGFDLVHVSGFDPNSPRIDNLLNRCGNRLPAGIGIPLSRPGGPG